MKKSSLYLHCPEVAQLAHRANDTVVGHQRAGTGRWCIGCRGQSDGAGRRACRAARSA